MSRRHRRQPDSIKVNRKFHRLPLVDLHLAHSNVMEERNETMTRTLICMCRSQYMRGEIELTGSGRQVARSWRREGLA